MSIPYTLGERDGSQTLTVIIDNETFVLDSSSPQFDRAIQSIKANDIDGIRKAIKIKEAIVEASTGRLELIDGVIFVKGEKLNHSLVSRIVKMFSEGFDINPLLLFLDNLLLNPSFRAQNELYGFLSACSLPITDDGHFMAYKKVKFDYKDIYTSSIDNSIGERVTMERNTVDEDSSRTCSNGLHVCSQDYLPHFGSSWGDADSPSRVVLVKINPRDVVAVPEDYDNAKMRVCEYTVISELEGYKDRMPDDFTTKYSDTSGCEDDCEDDCGDDCDCDWSDDDYDEHWDDEGEDESHDEDEDSYFEDSMSKTLEDDEDNLVDNTGVQLDLDLSEKTPTPTPARVKLSEADVYEILSEADDGWTMVRSAEVHDISQRQVGRVRRGEVWGDIKIKYENRKRYGI